MHYECVCLYSCLIYPACKQHAPYYIVTCDLPRINHIYYLHYPKNGTILGGKEKYWAQNVWFDFLYIFCLNYFSPYVEFGEKLLKMYKGIHVKYPFFLSDINVTLTFSADFLTILRYQISWKSLQWKPSCYMRTARHDEANAPKNDRSLQLSTAFNSQLTFMYDPSTSTTNSVTANMAPPNLPWNWLSTFPTEWRGPQRESNTQL
jgi:hypothetical protein